MELNTKNILIIIVIAAALIGTTVLVTSYALNYFSSAAEIPGSGSGAESNGFAPLPTSNPNPGLSFEECRSVSGTKNEKYDLNNDGIVTPLDCAKLN